jgi:hypothetical protein
VRRSLEGFGHNAEIRHLDRGIGRSAPKSIEACLIVRKETVAVFVFFVSVLLPLPA